MKQHASAVPEAITARSGVVSVLTGARLADGQAKDVVLKGERVWEVSRAGSLRHRSGERVDLRGYLLLPATAEPHAHLDKTETWDAVGYTGGDLAGAVAAWQRWTAGRSEADVRQRAERTLTGMLANGTTAVRTHVDLAPGPDPLTALRALLELREDWRDRVDLQVVPLLYEQTPDGLVRHAKAAGADLIGGCPHLADNPAAEVRRLVMLAEQHGIGLDIHVDESLDPASTTLSVLARLVVERNFPYPVTASHCVSLGQMAPAAQRSLIDSVAAARISVVALPQTNLYLQGRGMVRAQPRAITAFSALASAGVLIAAGGDNIADPFNPMGRADALETSSLLVSAAHLPVSEAFSAVSTDARRLIGLAPAGPEPGHRADLLAIRATSLADAVGRAPADRVVWRAGRVVARTTVTREIAGS